MKFSTTTVLYVTATAVAVGFSEAFSPAATTFGGVASVASQQSSSSCLFDIRPKTEKADNLRFGWDGSTALGMSF
jgi:hypothetical protein